MKKQKVWRPRIHESKASINREGKYFVVVCRSLREADMVEKALIRTLVKARK